MADQVRITNLPDGGSKERVAYDLARWINSDGKARDQKAILDLYAECLSATSDRRKTT